MKTYEEAVYRVALEYFGEVMNELMPRVNIDKCQMIAFIFDMDVEKVAEEVKATARENAKEWGR